MICTHCGKEIPDDSLFCGYCGEKVQEEDRPVDIETKVEDDTFQPQRPSEITEEASALEDTEVLNTVEPAKEKSKDSEETPDSQEKQDPENSEILKDESSESSKESGADDTSSNEAGREEQSQQDAEEQADESIVDEQKDTDMIDAEFTEKEGQRDEVKKPKQSLKVHFSDFKVLWRMLKNPYEENSAGKPAGTAGLLLLLLACWFFTSSFAYGALMAIALAGFTFLSCYCNDPKEFHPIAGVSKTLRILIAPMLLLFISGVFYGVFRSSFQAGVENYLTAFTLEGINVEAFAIAAILFSASLAVLAVHFVKINHQVNSLSMVLMITLMISVSFFCIYKGGMQVLLRAFMNLVSQVLSSLLQA